MGAGATDCIHRYPSKRIVESGPRRPGAAGAVIGPSPAGRDCDSAAGYPGGMREGGAGGGARWPSVALYLALAFGLSWAAFAGLRAAGVAFPPRAGST
jgi:hypothetical protein